MSTATKTGLNTAKTDPKKVVHEAFEERGGLNKITRSLILMEKIITQNFKKLWSQEKEIEILVHNVFKSCVIIFFFHWNEPSGHFIHNQNICSNKHF